MAWREHLPQAAPLCEVAARGAMASGAHAGDDVVLFPTDNFY